MKLHNSLKGLLLIASLGMSLDTYAFPWEEDKGKAQTGLEIRKDREERKEREDREERKVAILLSQDEVDACLEDSITTKELKNCINDVLVEKAGE